MTDDAAAAIEQPPAPKITAYALPGILGEIANATSVEIAIAVARAFGGTRLSLPRVPKPSHRLSRAVGVEAARAICARIGGETHHIPAARPLLRWHDAHRLRTQGWTYARIGRELGCSENHVWRMLQGFSAGDAATGG